MVLLRIIILTIFTALPSPPISQPIYLHRPARIRGTGFTLSQTCVKQAGNPPAQWVTYPLCQTVYVLVPYVLLSNVIENAILNEFRFLDNYPTQTLQNTKVPRLLETG